MRFLFLTIYLTSFFLANLCIAQPVAPKIQVPGKFKTDDKGMPVGLILDYSKSNRKFKINLGNRESESYFDKHYDTIFDKYSKSSYPRYTSLEEDMRTCFLNPDWWVGGTAQKCLAAIVRNMRENHGTWVVGVNVGSLSEDYIYGSSREQPDVAIILDAESLKFINSMIPKVSGFACEILKVITPNSGLAGGAQVPMCFGFADQNTIGVWKTIQLQPLTNAKLNGNKFVFSYNYEVYDLYSNKVEKHKRQLKIEMPNLENSLKAPQRTFKTSRIDILTGKLVDEAQVDVVDEMQRKSSNKVIGIDVSGSYTVLGSFCSSSSIFARCELR